MRLDQLLNVAGFGSRGEVQRLLKSKQVRVDDEVVMLGAQNVDSGLQRIEVGQQRILDFAEHYYLLNKPRGVVSAVTDAQHQTVIECLPPVLQHPQLYPVGRLDRDTTGLVLLTTNGPLGFRLLHPQYHVEKEYEVVVNGWLDQQAVDAFASGVVFSDGTNCKPALLQIIEQNKTLSKARVTLSEGKFHQIKKMFLTVGVKVIGLKRIRFGELRLEDSLPEGAWRELTAQELEYIIKYLKTSHKNTESVLR